MRGASWVVWGEEHMQEAYRSVASVRRFGLPTCIVTDHTTGVEPGRFDEIRRIDFQTPGLARDWHVLDESPFEQTLYIDSDVLMLQPAELGFSAAMRYGFAVTHAQSTHCYTSEEGELCHYSTGLIFFDRRHAVFPIVRDGWRTFIDEYSARGQNGFYCDQPGFSITLWRLGINPFVLPHTWNLAPLMLATGTWVNYGVKFWHSMIDPPAEFLEWNAAPAGTAFIRAAAGGTEFRKLR